MGLLVFLLGLTDASTSFRTEDTSANASSESTSNNYLLAFHKTAYTRLQEFYHFGAQLWRSWWGDIAHKTEKRSDAVPGAMPWIFGNQLPNSSETASLCSLSCSMNHLSVIRKLEACKQAKMLEMIDRVVSTLQTMCWSLQKAQGGHMMLTPW